MHQLFPRITLHTVAEGLGDTVMLMVELFIIVVGQFGHSFVNSNHRDAPAEPTAELAAFLIVHTTSTVFCHFERSEQKN